MFSARKRENFGQLIAVQRPVLSSPGTISGIVLGVVPGLIRIFPVFSCFFRQIGRSFLLNKEDIY